MVSVTCARDFVTQTLPSRFAQGRYISQKLRRDRPVANLHSEFQQLSACRCSYITVPSCCENPAVVFNIAVYILTFKGLSRLERCTRYWPMVISETLLCNMMQVTSRRIWFLCNEISPIKLSWTFCKRAFFVRQKVALDETFCNNFLRTFCGFFHCWPTMDWMSGFPLFDWLRTWKTIKSLLFDRLSNWKTNKSPLWKTT